MTHNLDSIPQANLNRISLASKQFSLFSSFIRLLFEISLYKVSKGKLMESFLIKAAFAISQTVKCSRCFKL